MKSPTFFNHLVKTTYLKYQRNQKTKAKVYKYHKSFSKMGVAFTTENKMADHGLHAVVFIAIGMLQLLAINAHPDNKLIAGVAGTALGPHGLVVSTTLVSSFKR